MAETQLCKLRDSSDTVFLIKIVECFVITFFKPKFNQEINPRELHCKLNELVKKRPGTSQMSERFGPNLAPDSFALQQSIRLVYTLRALSRGRNRSTRATRDNQDAHTQEEHTHARQRSHNTTASPRLRWGAGCCCCCCCACCCCAAASRPATNRGAQPVTTDCFSFGVLWNARRSE